MSLHNSFTRPLSQSPISSSNRQIVVRSRSFSNSLQSMHFRSSYGGGSRLGFRGCAGRKVFKVFKVFAVSDPLSKMNFNEYMVTLDKPLGIRFALSLDGAILVHSLRKGGNAEKSRIIMVGDALKKAGHVSEEGAMVDIKNLADTQKVLKATSGSFSLILERPSSPFPIQQLCLLGDHDVIFNKGRVPLSTWNSAVHGAGMGNPGFIIFSPRLLQPKGWELLSRENHEISDFQTLNNGFMSKQKTEFVGIFAEECSEEVEWSFGSFPLDEYLKALDRSKGELYYNHSLGMQYSKITEQIYIGSCMQTENDVQTLASTVGITAIINFQSESERVNWGINSESINDACRRYNILTVNYPIREVDSMDLRRKLPFCVGLLLRLLRKNFRVFLTCTTGFERSPTCVIAYLHWIQDTALHAAHNFVTGLHSCRPDRAAIVWATWDLIALVELGMSDGPPTHVVTFVWTNGCQEGEEVHLVGDFTANWKESVRLGHKGGPRFEADVRLRHGKYGYKFVVGGHWRHSTSLPTETDQAGNVNNVIRVGDIARIRFFGGGQQYIKDPTVVKVIERPLTEDERFMLAFAARRIAFAICPITLAPK
ncbi:phosphoglucan phosphatase LSF1, chloroplastic [Wolffia australiana]